mgnify:FL=1
MSEGKKIRLSKVLKEFNISMVTAVEYLKKEKGIEIESNPNTSITEDIVKFLSNKFNADKSKREVSKEIVEDKRKEREAIRIEQEKENQEKRKQQEQEVIKAKAQLAGLKPVGKIDLEEGNKKEGVAPAQEAPKPEITTSKQEVTTSKTKTTTSKQEATPDTVQSQPSAKNNKEKDKKKDNNKPDAQKNKSAYQNPLAQTVATQKKKEQQNHNSKEELTSEIPAGVIETQYQKLTGPKVVGEKIDLSQFEKKKKMRIYIK